MPAKKKVILPPSFKLKSELARYVDPDELKNGGRVSSGAFMPTMDDTDCLSVNSIEIDSLNNIANYYHDRFNSNGGEIGIATRKILHFNDAARKAGIEIRKNTGTKCWEYIYRGKILTAYKHRPTPISKSHCGIEYLNINIDEKILKKIARRLSGKRPHLYKIPK